MSKQPPIVIDGSRVVNALEDAWATIRNHHPELPDVVIVLAGSRATRHRRLGHFAARCWQHDDQRLGRIFVGEETLNTGAVGVLGKLLHEAAHALAHVRTISDTSRRGRHHTRRFAKLANELGIYVGHGPHLGRSSSTPTTDSMQRYRTALDDLDRALQIYRRREPTEGGNATASTTPGACACDGGRQIRVARTTLGVGPIICRLCGSQFDAH